MTDAILGHFLGGRSLKGRCNSRVCVPVRVPLSVCVCVCVCVSLLSPPDPAIARPTPGKNYPVKSARNSCQRVTECVKAPACLKHFCTSILTFRISITLTVWTIPFVAHFRNRTPTPNPEIPKADRVYVNFFEKSA